MGDSFGPENNLAMVPYPDGVIMLEYDSRAWGDILTDSNLLKRFRQDRGLDWTPSGRVEAPLRPFDGITTLRSSPTPQPLT